MSITIHGANRDCLKKQLDVVNSYITTQSISTKPFSNRNYSLLWQEIFLESPCFYKDKPVVVPALMRAVTIYDQNKGCPGAFVLHVLPILAEIALSYHGVTHDQLAILPGQNNISQFSQQECLSILSASFYCAFPRKSYNCTDENGELPSINFVEMHTSKNKAEIEKLLMYFLYFEETILRWQQKSSLLQSRLITFIRQSVSLPIEDLLKDCSFIPAIMHSIGASIDDQIDMVRIDFANKYIGGGSLAYGCVQEEITFTQCPALNVSRLFHTPMSDKEAIILINSEQFSTSMEYGSKMKFGGKCTRAFTENAIIALDAVDYRCRSLKYQYTAAAINRELLKCVAGFQNLTNNLCIYGISSSSSRRIATGNWGCGVFRGNAHLKLLVQWIACSLCGLEMHYFPYNRTDLYHEFPDFASLLLSQSVTTRSLYQSMLLCLHSYDPGKFPDSVWTILRRHYEDVSCAL